MRISKVDREEMLALSRSQAMRDDAREVAERRHNPLLRDGVVSAQRVVEFLTQYNEFLNHPMKPFERPIEDNMKL